MADQGIDREALKQHKEITDAILGQGLGAASHYFEFSSEPPCESGACLLSKYPDLFERENVEVRREPDELGVDFLVETKLKYHA